MSTKASKSTLLNSFSNTCIIAIHSTSLAYSLAWCLDETFSTQFICEPEKFKITLPNGLEESYHVQYFFGGSDIQSRMWLVQNQGSARKLFTEKPIPDFWLIIENKLFYNQMEDWVTKIKEMSKVQTAYIFPKQKLNKLDWIMNLNHIIE